MSFYREIQSLKAQIVDTQRLLAMVADHPLMSESLSIKLRLLEEKLQALPNESFEPSVQLLFSGNAVHGSHGIKSSFISKALAPFQEMIKTQVALHSFGSIGTRGRVKNKKSSELYLTALPTGSFGVELTQLKSEDLFGDVNISNAMKDVMKIIESTAHSDASFEQIVGSTPKRNLSSLKSFLKNVSEEKSILKIESGEMSVDLPKEKVEEAYHRVASTVNNEQEIFIAGVFRGMLLDSGRFEIQTEDGKKISGFIREGLTEEQLVAFDQNFLNRNCLIHLKVHKISFKTGNQKTDYELLDIQPQ